MALIIEPIETGNLNGARYTAEFKGDDFPTHTHTDADIHISIITLGSWKCKGRPEIDGEILTPGMVIDWNVGEPHGFNAMEDNSQMVNIRKNVKVQPKLDNVEIH
jgi:hypothetical protein